MALLRLIGSLINLLARLAGRHDLRDLDRLQVLYGHLDDGQLREELSRILSASQATRTEEAGRWRWLSRFQDSPSLRALAIGVCLFDRHPCDLPPGSTAYDEQRLAALMLIARSNVQMDTGEGKTYAIALAATALLAEHPQVIVITVNAYLAKRDRARVGRYFESAGIACEYGMPSAAFRGVSYITMSDLCFGYLNFAYRSPGSPPLGYPAQAAVIIDEIDSVLLDQAPVHNLVRLVPSDERLWGDVFALVDRWDDAQYAYDPVSDDFSLTPSGWGEIAILSRQAGKPASLLMRLAAAALWARQAEEGRHYMVEDGQVRMINQVTGETFDSGDPQQAALVYLITGHNPVVSLRIAEINGLTLLQRHDHVVGLSGTATYDTVYYLQQLRTLTSYVPARFLRHQGKVATRIASSAEAAFGYVSDRIRDVAPRPVVIGTWSPAQARAVAERLRRDDVVEESKLNVITAFDSNADAAALGGAGELGRVTVLSQGGSRGVDVRSTHRPLLLILGMAVEPRLDRQFLGRVGRHGEPFDAECIIDPSSPIQVPRRLVAMRGEAIWPLERTVARSLSQLQRDVWSSRIRRRQQATVLSRAVGEVEAAVAAELGRLRQLGSDASLTDYVVQLCAEPLADQGAVGSDNEDSADRTQLRDMQALIIKAIERRRSTDQLVVQFEAAVCAGVGAAEGSYRLRTTVPGEPTELVALTQWLNERSSMLEQAGDTATAALFRRHAAAAAEQYLPVLTTPHRRDAVDVIFETRLMANATLLEQTSNRLGSLWVTSSPDAYYRRGAFIVRNLHSLSELSIRRDILTNLSAVDCPANLDDLYYSEDHRVITSSPNYHEPLVSAPQADAPTAAALSVEIAEAVIGQFLTELEHRRGGLAIPPETARLLLIDVLQPLMVGSNLMGTAALERRIKLTLDSIAAKGTRGAKFRDHRRLIFDFTDYLQQRGILKDRLVRKSVVRNAISRARDFADTIPRFGILAVGGYLALMALATLPIAGQDRHAGFVTIASRLFGFGSVLPERPFLIFFAVLAALQAAIRACYIADPTILITRLMPIFATAFSLIFYDRGVTNLGWTILLIIAMTAWSELLFVSHRFVTTFIGVDANMIIAAASTAVFLITEARAGSAQNVFFIGLGMIAAVAGPTVPVSIGSQEYAKGRFRYQDERARVRVPLDPPAASGLAAFVVTFLARIHGALSAIGFALMQLLALVLIADQRLRAERIKGVLAKLQVGTPLDDEDLRSYLRRALARSAIVAAAALSAAVTFSLLAGEQSTITFLFDEWAGIVLLTGTLSIGSALSVAGYSTPLVQPSDESRSTLARLRELRERLRAWRRMRFAWIWKTVVFALVIFGALRWISDLLGVFGVSVDITRIVEHLLKKF